MAARARAPAGPPAGFILDRRVLDDGAQRALLDEVSAILAAAPPLRPMTPFGKPLRNAVSNCGAWGWMSSRAGYAYVDRHPETGLPWPPMPAAFSRLATRAAARAGFPGFEPDACLVNLYDAGGRLSRHRDHDEADYAWPIVSVSLGCTARFALGGLRRQDPVTNMLLFSGDVLVLGGESRLRYHAVTGIVAGTAPFPHPALPPGGRINLTMRRAR